MIDGAFRPDLRAPILVIGDHVGSPDAEIDPSNLHAARERASKAALPQRPGLAKAGRRKAYGVPMSGIFMILAFVVVMAALNWFEFGRLD